jgi:hypothetical protein
MNGTRHNFIPTFIASAILIATGVFGVAHAAFNPEINYQGKLTDSSS